MAARLPLERQNVIKMFSLLKNRLDDFGGGGWAELMACEPTRYIDQPFNSNRPNMMPRRGVVGLHSAEEQQLSQFRITEADKITLGLDYVWTTEKYVTSLTKQNY